MSNPELILENSRIRAKLLPGDGGRLVSLVDKRTGRDYVWINKRTADLPRYYGADYDSLGAGGVEEAFPCVLPENRSGDSYPFFGEVWSVPWQVETASAMEVTLSRYSSLLPARIRKTWRLSEDSLTCAYVVENEDARPIRCLFGVHPSFAVRGGDRLALPEGRYSRGVFIPPETACPPEFDWPLAGAIDLTLVPPDGKSGTCYQFHSPAMPAGFLRITGNDGGGIEMSYDHRFFTSLCVWPIYGGWRGHYVLMAEFFTGWPLKLSEAEEQGNCLAIEPGSNVKTNVVFSFTQHA